MSLGFGNEHPLDLGMVVLVIWLFSSVVVSCSVESRCFVFCSVSIVFFESVVAPSKALQTSDLKYLLGKIVRLEIVRLRIVNIGD